VRENGYIFLDIKPLCQNYGRFYVTRAGARDGIHAKEKCGFLAEGRAITAIINCHNPLLLFRHFFTVCGRQFSHLIKITCLDTFPTGGGRHYAPASVSLPVCFVTACNCSLFTKICNILKLCIKYIAAAIIRTKKLDYSWCDHKVDERTEYRDGHGGHTDRSYAVRG